MARLDHIDWLNKNIDKINEFFETDFRLDTTNDRLFVDECIDIYDTESDFNDDFEGIYDNKNYAFELKSSEGYAVEIDGKFVAFNEVNYERY